AATAVVAEQLPTRGADDRVHHSAGLAAGAGHESLRFSRQGPAQRSVARADDPAAVRGRDRVEATAGTVWFAEPFPGQARPPRAGPAHRLAGRTRPRRHR